MARKPTTTTAPSTATIGFESRVCGIWLTADKLRNNMDAAEYKHVVLGLIFLKYISDTFEEHRAKLLAGQGDYAGANAEDPDEYKAENVFWVPAETRWSHLQASAKQPTIGKIVDDAKRDTYLKSQGLSVLHFENDRVLNDTDAVLQEIASHLPSPTGRGAGGEGRQDAESSTRSASHRSVDLLGRVYEYFLTMFASAEGKNGGQWSGATWTAIGRPEGWRGGANQFYTPSCVVRFLVEMLAPYKGRIYDPACGSGGMFGDIHINSLSLAA